MKRILLFVSIIMSLAFVKSEVRDASVMIMPSSKILINVKTNVNSIKCQYNVLKLKEPIAVFFKKFDEKIIFDKTALILENVDFDCGGSAINKDFQELLKSKTYPQITIDLKEINRCGSEAHNVEALVDLNIAGVTKSFNVPVRFENNGNLYVKGSLNLNIRDFNIEPPRKALGLVVVKDMIEIDFQLTVKEY